MADIGEVVTALRTLRPHVGITEAELHEQVKAAFDGAGIEYSHEERLTSHSRIDFLVGDIGVEIKKSGIRHERAMAQLERYAQSERVAAIVIVMGRGASMPKTICGKPCVVVTLGALWGLALR